MIDKKNEPIKLKAPFISTGIRVTIDMEHKKAKDAAKRAAFKQTEEYKKDEARRMLLQQLDKDNKKSPNTRIFNTIKFFNEFVKALVTDFKELVKQKQVNTITLKKLVNNYSIHIEVLKKFDEEVELNEELGYNEKLTTTLHNVLSKHIPVLANELNLNEENTQEIKGDL